MRRAQGRLDEVADVLEPKGYGLEYRTYPIVDCLLAGFYDEVGRETDARTMFDKLAADGFAPIPFDEEWLVSLSLLAEVAHSIDDRPRAEVLYDRLSPYAKQIAVSIPEISTGSVSRFLGLLATTLVRSDEAERHFVDALTVNERIGARPWVAQTRKDYATLLRSRNGPGDREKARDLLDRARGTYRELGMESFAARLS